MMTLPALGAAAGRTAILSAAKNLVRARATEILRCAQDDNRCAQDDSALRLWVQKIVLLVLAGIGVAGPAAGAEPAPWQHKQQIQQRVRGMARELVGGVLAVQVQQLRENGLEGLPIYAEIGQMQQHLDLLVDTEMGSLLEVLARADAAPAEQRDRALLDARQKSRQIVVTLLEERQTLLRRLKIAEMAAQVQQLIELQTVLLGTTQSLPEQPVPRREPLTLTAIEDQRDIAAIYDRLKVLLAEVSRWPGTQGAEAAEGLRLLEVGHVDGELKNAEEHLRSARLPEAAASQKAVILGLQALLVQVKKLQGITEGDRHSAEDVLQQMIQQQEQVREMTRETDLAQPEADKLISRQAEIRKQIAEIRQAPQTPPETRPLLASAEAAAQEAAAKLFEQKRDDALARQDNVVNQLRQAAEAAHKAESAQAAQQKKAQQTAQQAAHAADDLRQAREELKQIRRQQDQASAAAAERPAEARKQEHEIAQRLGQVPEKRQLPEEVHQQVAAAQQAVHAAAAKMDHPPEARHEATRRAEQAIDRALSQTEAALADAQRMALSTKQQELQQAAEQARGAEAAAARQQAAKTAQQLARTVSEQLQQVHQARQAVEEKLVQRLDSLGQKLQRLARAEDKVAEAAAQQERAAGRPQAAEARQQAHQLAKALEQQDQADRAAELAAQERAGKDHAEAPSKPSPARQALAEAHQRALAKVREATRAPAGKPDPQAQQEVSRQAAEAQQMAQPDAAEAAATLQQAGQHSAEAAQHAARDKPQPAAQAQQATAALLDRAAEQLAQARQELSRHAGQPFAHESRDAKRLSEQAVPADPAATAALQSAENKARQAAAQSPQMPARAGAADSDVQQDLEQAAARLAAREQQIRAAAELAARAGADHPAQAQAQPPASPEAAQPAPSDQAASPKPSHSDQATSQPSHGRSAELDSQAGKVPGQVGAMNDPRVKEEPWFAKLPPEVRSAIRSNAQRTPPRGYEERLQRYFQNIE
jgi:hypothetical protein